MLRQTTASELDALIARYIEPHPDPIKAGHAWYRLKERGVPVYAIIGSLTPTHDNDDDVADAFGVSREAVEAAIAYYGRHKTDIDNRMSSGHAA
ncbi:MAG TPA: hypothetical protein VGP33_02945 [Chloroflexota bacterium]|nr:hypothetical protein [Chloroflexota bacterium]